MKNQFILAVIYFSICSLLFAQNYSLNASYQLGREGEYDGITA